MRVIMPAVKVRIGQDGLPGDIVESNVLRRQFGCRGDDDRVAHPFRVIRRGKYDLAIQAYGGAALDQIVERLLDFLLGFGVDRGSGFVENQDARVDQ